jgi:hypothetical protein
MEFDRELNMWICDTNIFEDNVTIKLVDIDIIPNANKELICRSVIAYVTSKLEEIENNILNKFLDLYNQAWVNPEEDALPLTKEAFLSKIKLEGVIYEVEDEDSVCYFLYYSDSDIFCGHSIEVFIENDGEIECTLVG